MTREDIIKMARQVRDGGHWNQLDLINFANLVAAAERSACAQVCELMTHPEASSDLAWSARACAAAIRSRGEK